MYDIPNEIVTFVARFEYLYSFLTLSTMRLYAILLTVLCWALSSYMVAGTGDQKIIGRVARGSFDAMSTKIPMIKSAISKSFTTTDVKPDQKGSSNCGLNKRQFSQGIEHNADQAPMKFPSGNNAITGIFDSVRSIVTKDIIESTVQSARYHANEARKDFLRCADMIITAKDNYERLDRAIDIVLNHKGTVAVAALGAYGLYSKSRMHPEGWVFLLISRVMNIIFFYAYVLLCLSTRTFMYGIIRFLF